MQRIYEKFPNLAVTRHRDGTPVGVHLSYALRTNPLPPLLEKAIEENFGKYALDYSEKMRAGTVDVRSLFANPERRLVLEIGFGDGKNSFRIARDNPDVNYLAFDVYLHGFASYLKMIADSGTDNVRVCRYDAEDFIRHSVPDGSVDGFNVFFPDPWVKRRQNKRRLINPEFALILADKLRASGFVHVATDIPEYASRIIGIFSGIPSLRNAYDGFAPNCIGRYVTTFEQKGADEGRQSFDIYFTKV